MRTAVEGVCRMTVDIKERLTKFALSLYEDKTRLIEFGRLQALA